jgi:hypothetical protein
VGLNLVKPTTKGFTQCKYQLSFIFKIPHDNGQVYGHFVFQNALAGILQLHVISSALDVAFAGGQCLCHLNPSGLDVKIVSLTEKSCPLVVENGHWVADSASQVVSN